MDIEYTTPEAGQGFVIDSPGKADWAIEKIKEARAQRDLYILAADEKIADLEAKKAKAMDNCARDTEFLLVQLNQYLDTVPHRRTKTQIAVDLPSGKLVRKLPTIDFARDDAAIIDHLQGSVYVEAVPKLRWADLKKTLVVTDAGDVLNQETGEIIPGVTAVEKPASFDIK